MSTAYKCDEYGELFMQKEQDIRLTTLTGVKRVYPRIDVGPGSDLCRQCIIKALKEALENIKN